MTLIERLEATVKALTVEEVSDLLGISKQHIYEMVADGSIPAFHVGRSIRLDPQELADWLRKIKPPAKQSAEEERVRHHNSEPDQGRTEVASAHRIWRKHIHHLEVAASGE